MNVLSRPPLPPPPVAQRTRPRHCHSSLRTNSRRHAGREATLADFFTLRTFDFSISWKKKSKGNTVDSRVAFYFKTCDPLSPLLLKLNSRRRRCLGNSRPRMMMIRMKSLEFNILIFVKYAQISSFFFFFVYTHFFFFMTTIFVYLFFSASE